MERAGLDRPAAAVTLGQNRNRPDRGGNTAPPPAHALTVQKTGTENESGAGEGLKKRAAMLSTPVRSRQDAPGKHQAGGIAMQNQKPVPGAGFILGLFFFGVSWGWQQFTGGSLTSQDKLYFSFFQYLGVMSLLFGVSDLYLRYRRREKRRQAEEPSGVHGTASFASREECAAAGLTDPDGLYLGVLGSTPLFYNGKAHLLTVAPARQGKGINVVIPNLLHYQGSVFVTDPKGELAAVTAAHRRETFGQQVCILNPWELHGLAAHRYNPLQPLIEAAHDPQLLRGIADEAKALALQLLPEPDDQRNKYFRDGSRKILRALMLHLATRGDPGSCTLTGMWRILNNKKRLLEIVPEMAGSPALNGMVADLGEDLSHEAADNPEHFGDFRTGAAEAVDIFDPNGPLGNAVTGSDVDFRALKEGRVSVYLVIPQDRIATHGAWLGLVARQAITAVARSPGKTPVLFLLDEFANMGRLTGLAESLTALPGLGVRVWAFVQELAELKRIYGEHTAETVLSQAEVKQFFAVQSLSLAKMLSAALGQKTVKTTSFNLGRSDDDEVGTTLGETGRPLLSPEDIRQMGKDQQLLFIESLPPVRARRIPFWYVAPW